MVKELENESLRIRRLQPPALAASTSAHTSSAHTPHSKSPDEGSPTRGMSPFVSVADLANMTTQERHKYEADAAASLKRNLMRHAATSRAGSPMPNESRSSSRLPSPRGRGSNIIGGSSMSPLGSANNLTNLLTASATTTNPNSAPSSFSFHDINSATTLTNNHNHNHISRNNSLTPIKSISSPQMSPSGSRRELARLANTNNNNSTDNNSIKQSSFNRSTPFGSRQFNSSLIGGLNGGSLELGLPQITRIWTPHEINMQKVIQRRGGELYILTAAGATTHPTYVPYQYIRSIQPFNAAYRHPSSTSPSTPAHLYQPLSPPPTPYHPYQPLSTGTKGRVKAPWRRNRYQRLEADLESAIQQVRQPTLLPNPINTPYQPPLSTPLITFRITTYHFSYHHRRIC